MISPSWRAALCWRRSSVELWHAYFGRSGDRHGRSYVSALRMILENISDGVAGEWVKKACRRRLSHQGEHEVPGPASARSAAARQPDSSRRSRMAAIEPAISPTLSKARARAQSSTCACPERADPAQNPVEPGRSRGTRVNLDYVEQERIKDLFDELRAGCALKRAGQRSGRCADQSRLLRQARAAGAPRGRQERLRDSLRESAGFPQASDRAGMPTPCGASASFVIGNMSRTNEGLFIDRPTSTAA